MGTQDEATFGLIPLIMRGWARRGSHPIVKINHKNECTNVFGARSAKSFVYFSERKKDKNSSSIFRKITTSMGEILAFCRWCKSA